MARMTKSTKASRKDVAKLAGVSLTTVTHALNETPDTRLRPETIKRVQAAAAELDYRPNFVGRALITGKTFTVGLLQPSYKSLFSDFYQRIIFGMVGAMEQDDYNLVTMFRSPQQKHLKPIQQGRVDGMLILQSELDNSHIDTIITTGIPTVVVNGYYPTAKQLPVGNVRSDHQQLMQNVMQQFVKLNCKSVLAFHDYLNCDPNRQINNAFIDIINNKLNNRILGSTVIPAKDNLQQQIRNLFKNGQQWDGIFVDGYATADLILEEAKKNGLKHKKDFHLIVEDCYKKPDSRSIEEASSYIQSPVEVGAAAWQLMHKLINETTTEREILIPYKKIK
ncbi:MAG: LacI family transcriptional regulator [Victivallaceae bacterium]|nr:LacI family transcriptional regulator [Victivallaceae bacterium]